MFRFKKKPNIRLPRKPKYEAESILKLFLFRGISLFNFTLLILFIMTSYIDLRIACCPNGCNFTFAYTSWLFFFDVFAIYNYYYMKIAQFYTDCAYRWAGKH